MGCLLELISQIFGPLLFNLLVLVVATPFILVWALFRPGSYGANVQAGYDWLIRKLA